MYPFDFAAASFSATMLLLRIPSRLLLPVRLAVAESSNSNLPLQQDAGGLKLPEAVEMEMVLYCELCQLIVVTISDAANVASAS